MFSVQTSIKFMRARVKWFFIRNRDIEWTRQKIGLTLAVTLLSGAILGQFAVRWLVPDAGTYHFRVTRSEESISKEVEAVPDVRIQEQSVGLNTLDSRGKKSDIRTTEDIIAEYFPEDPKTAIAIAKAESGLRANAYNENRNGSNDGGIFQINSVHGYSLEQRFDPIENVKIARKIYEKSGWSAWSAWKNNSFKKFL